jgi:rhodanese-related sulfurtransferase
MKATSLFVLLLLVTTSAWAEIIEIDNQRLKGLLAKGIPIVDIRTAPEWTETGVVEGSHLLTFFDASGNYDARSWLTSLEPIADQGDPVILICRTGRRTGLVSQFLVNQVGFARVYNVTKGIRHWIDTGNPVVAP